MPSFCAILSYVDCLIAIAIGIHNCFVATKICFVPSHSPFAFTEFSNGSFIEIQFHGLNFLLKESNWMVLVYWELCIYYHYLTQEACNHLKTMHTHQHLHFFLRQSPEATNLAIHIYCLLWIFHLNELHNMWSFLSDLSLSIIFSFWK
jgi:hypothetical protein